MKATMKRRQMLVGSGVAIALPLLDATVPRRARAATAPKRFVTFFTPNGVPDAFFPKGTERAFALGPCLQPLEKHKSRLLVFDGLENKAAYDCGEPSHQSGMVSCLTGVTPKANCSHIGEIALGPSIDQTIADVVGTNTRFRNLLLGVSKNGSPFDSVSGSVSQLPNQHLFPEVQPARVFERMFLNAKVDAQVSLTSLAARRKSVLDGVLSPWKSMATNLSPADRIRVDSYLTSIRSLEKELSPVASTLSCGGQTPPAAVAFDSNYVPKVGKIQLRLLALALACDLTRVGSFMWLGSGSQDTVYSWLGHHHHHHKLSHKEVPDDELEKAEAQLVQINEWYAQQLAAFLDMLVELQPAGEDSLVANTTVLWWNELGNGNHSMRRCPFVVAGGLANVPMGRLVAAPRGTSNNDLLLSIYNAVTDKRQASFGDPKLCRGPLVGL